MRKGSVPLTWAFVFALVFCFCSVPSRAQQTGPVNDVRPLLSNLDDVVTSIRVSLAKLRIEKWKTQSEVKRRLQSDAASIDRNLTQALPTLVDGLRTAPESLAANFAMYRNLDAVHDVLNLLAQTAGAVAPDEEFSPLASAASRLDELRRNFADRMEMLSANKDAELVALQRNASAKPQEPAAPAKKIVVDDTAPAKPKPKTTKRKSQ
jgi:hypothetical protein